MRVPKEFGHWFAGFVAGEGTFGIAKRGKTCYTPGFALVLRADDTAIVEECRDRFGGIGRLYTYKFVKRADNYRHAARIEWKIDKKSDLLAFVEIMDLFPLRARKSRDYAIWSRAVKAWGNRKGHRGARGSHSPHPIQKKMAEWKKELEDARRCSELLYQGASAKLEESLSAAQAQ